MIDSVAYSGDGGDNGSVGIDIVCKGNYLTYSVKWLNRGTSTWNFWYGGCNVFLIGVVVFVIGGVVGMREVDSSNIGGSVFADAEEFCDPVLYVY